MTNYTHIQLLGLSWRLESLFPGCRGASVSTAVWSAGGGESLHGRQLASLLGATVQQLHRHHSAAAAGTRADTPASGGHHADCCPVLVLARDN